MASLGTPLPQFHEAKSSATTLLWQVYHCRPRTQRTKVLALATISFLLFWFLLSRSSSVSVVMIIAPRGQSINQQCLRSRHRTLTTGRNSPRAIPFPTGRKMRNSCSPGSNIPSTVPCLMICPRPIPSSMSWCRPRILPAASAGP
ncbi:hypothetical protein N7510_002005 [Penicillium lagena]|uniref:uncharacterized protein n=1 Tax=Penicillium lagena TaxID=94218 RepID=UPI0025401E57|nr:uncharacterized protein N7510_002005 [Penicillium lagena]KAJ5625696.1 hypothetical protein N7510_002005 [Penicillium lagena]